MLLLRTIVFNSDAAKRVVAYMPHLPVATDVKHSSGPMERACKAEDNSLYHFCWREMMDGILQHQQRGGDEMEIAGHGVQNVYICVNRIVQVNDRICILMLVA